MLIAIKRSRSEATLPVRDEASITSPSSKASFGLSSIGNDIDGEWSDIAWRTGTREGVNSCTDGSLCDINPPKGDKGLGVVGRDDEDGATAADEESRPREEVTVP